MKLRNEFEQRLRSKRKNVFCSKKLLFEPIFVNCKMKMAFLSNFSPLFYVGIYLVNWRKDALKWHFHFAVEEKRLKKQFFGAEYSFFL